MEKKTIPMDKETVTFYKAVVLARVADIAYKKYKFDWLYYNVGSIEDVLDEIEEQFQKEVEEGENPTPLSVWDGIVERGIYGEMFVCKYEFINNEFKDKEYITNLLAGDPNVLKDYLACIDSFKGDENADNN